MAKLDLSDVQSSINKVIDAQPSDNKYPWVLLTHVGQTPKLKVQETGDAFDEFLDELSDGKLMYGLIKFNLNGVYKAVYISWCPDGIDGVIKGKSSMWFKDFEFAIKGKYHTQIAARNEDDIDLDEIKKKLKVATGASYTLSSNVKNLSVDQAKDNIAKQQQDHIKGTGVERIDNLYKSDALKEQSAKFWSAQQKQEEKPQPLKPATQQIKADVSGLKDRFAEQVRVSNETKTSSYVPPPRHTVQSRTVPDEPPQREEPVKRAEPKKLNIQERFQEKVAEPEPVVQHKRYEPPQQQQQEQQQHYEPEPEPEPEQHYEPPQQQEEQHYEPEPEPEQHYEPPQQEEQHYEAPVQEEEVHQAPQSNEKRYRAMYDFDATDPEELSFREGDVLIVLKDEGDWWTAKHEGSDWSGFIPANYIELI